MKVTRISTLSGVQHTMDLDVTQVQLDRFENRRQTGEYILDIFPELTPREREFILSGITPFEWNEAYGEKEIYCVGKGVEEVIKELSELSSYTFICLHHWNGNGYVRTAVQHIKELEHLKNSISKNII